jgi:2-oxoglutarate ferredoxin oxidoreductase subunit alpha
MRQLLVNELEIDPAKLIRVLHFDGTPITARFITRAISNHVDRLASKSTEAVVSPQAAKASA